MNGQVSSTDTVSSRTEFLRAERRARHFWVTGIVGLLGLQVIIGFTAIMLSIGDSTVTVIPNYYQSAVDWDTTRRARQLTQQLGWHVTPSAGPTETETATRELRVLITSDDGDSVSDLNVLAKVYHHAQGSRIHEIRLYEESRGVYVGITGLTKPGLWQIDLQIEGEHGIAAESQEMTVR